MDKRTRGNRVGRPKDPPFAQRKEGINVRTDFSDARWWSKDAVAHIEKIASLRVLRSAKTLVRGGKVLEIDVKPGLVEAKVQGRRKSPYHVRLHFPLPGEGELREVKRRLSERALYGAVLLSGEMPEAIEDIFIASGSHFLPLGTGRERFFCSCPEPDDCCKHIVAVLYAAAGLFDNDPFLLLKLRGIDNGELLGSILVSRGSQTAPSDDCDAAGNCAGRVEDSRGGEEYAPEDPFPLDASFYGGENSRDGITDCRQHVITQAAAHSSLVPLFDFLLWHGESSFSESIEPYYESARKLLKWK